jgi:hypothetical protein
MNRCKNCKQPISNRAIYCSDRCTKAYKRNSDIKASEVGHNSDKPELGHANSDTLTEADQTFYDRQVRDEMGDYYYFSSERFERKCRHCKARFTTSLDYLHYCSYDHYQQALRPTLSI